MAGTLSHRLLRMKRKQPDTGPPGTPSQHPPTVEGCLAQQVAVLADQGPWSRPLDGGRQALVGACVRLVSAHGQDTPPAGRTLLSEVSQGRKQKKKPKQDGKAPKTVLGPETLPQNAIGGPLGLFDAGQPWGLVCKTEGLPDATLFTASFGEGVLVRFQGDADRVEEGLGILVGVTRGQLRGGCAYLPCYRQADLEPGGEARAPSGWSGWRDQEKDRVREVWASPDKRLAGCGGSTPEQVLISSRAYFVGPGDILGIRAIMPADTWEPSQVSGMLPLYYSRCLDEGARKVVDMAPSAKELLLERSGAPLLGVGCLMPQIMAACVRVPVQDFFKELNTQTGTLDAGALSARAAKGVLLRMPFPVLAGVLCASMVQYERRTRRWATTCAGPPALERLLHLDAGDLGAHIGVSH